ncbi:alpha/beta fold hydrolase [Pedobacter sp. LMG 31464]|uniref:Alpha/beta fold hydrolase n=1 Tax=Pedobacter planticolens TaxID=2679964 RepID=A0A923DUW1_9SPHI|nr:alpha/beta hydrolase [Pedobacter planticolens]MBB2144321.1 alpha/beta fold hydrolase [Pedobacter planticolens]
MQAQLNQIQQNFLPHCATQAKDIILLHGLFGNLSNWKTVEKRFAVEHKVWAPELPLFNNLIGQGLNKLVTFLEQYIDQNKIVKPVLIGNSLGGHVALLYTLKHPGKVEKLVLTGSFGLYENTFGGSFPRVKDYNYIKAKIEDVFYQKEVVDDEMINHVFGVVQHKLKVLSIIGLARDAQKQNLAAYLPDIQIPVLLIWGLQDIVTPPAVADEFNQLLPNATLHYINHCGHAPMMEQPELFNTYVSQFLVA